MSTEGKRVRPLNRHETLVKAGETLRFADSIRDAAFLVHRMGPFPDLSLQASLAEMFRAAGNDGPWVPCGDCGAPIGTVTRYSCAGSTETCAWAHCPFCGVVNEADRCECSEHFVACLCWEMSWFSHRVDLPSQPVAAWLLDGDHDLDWDSPEVTECMGPVVQYAETLGSLHEVALAVNALNNGDPCSGLEWVASAALEPVPGVFTYSYEPFDPSPASGSATMVYAPTQKILKSATEALSAVFASLADGLTCIDRRFGPANNAAAERSAGQAR